MEKESIFCTGHWWLPGKPDLKVIGDLKYDSRKGFILDLHGTFRDRDQWTGAPLHYDVIHGRSRGKGDITLVGCDEPAANPFTLMALSTIKIDVVLTGRHFSSSSDISFQRVRIDYAYLHKWLGVTGISLAGYDMRDLSHFTIKYDKPEPILLARTDEYEISIHFTQEIEGLNFPEEITVKEKPILVIKFAKEKSFDHCRLLIRRLQHFLALAVSEPIVPIGMKGMPGPSSENGAKGAYTGSVDIHFLITRHTIEFKWLPHMLFTYEDVKDEIDTAIQRWLSKAPRFQLAWDLFFDVLYNTRMELEGRVINLSFALEAYHRMAYRNVELDPEAHRQRITAILSSVPKDHKEWLRGKLSYSNEPTFRRRLKDLIEFYGEVTDEEVPQGTIQRIIDTRNFYVHYDESLKVRAAEGQELMDTVDLLTSLVEACLLKELGFSSSKIRMIMRKKG